VSFVKTLTKVDSFLLLASSPPDGVRSQRLSELGVTCVVQSSVSNSSGSGSANNEDKDGSNSAPYFRSIHSDGLEIVNVMLSDNTTTNHRANFEFYDEFCAKIQEVEKAKGVALVLSDETCKIGGLNGDGGSKAGGGGGDGSGAALCVAFLIKAKKMALETALSAVRDKRPELKPSSSLVLELHDYEAAFAETAGLKGRLAAGMRSLAYRVFQNWLPITIYFLLLITLVRFVGQLLTANDSEEDADMYLDDPKLPCL